MNDNILLRVENVVRHFPVQRTLLGRVRAAVHAVDGVSFTVQRGETFGLVGESGCGKSTLARCITRLDEPTSGRILFEGEDILALDRRHLRQIRRHIQTVFQDPYSSLNPRKRVEHIVGDAFAIHRLQPPEGRRQKVMELLQVVGLSAEHLRRFPHEFSGGQRQRIGIARALALNPKLVVADEAVSALDVSVRAQIINLFLDLQERFGLTYIFISHDLSIVRNISDRVAVMYLGQFVEMAPTQTLFSRPMHPYTGTLIAAVPRPAPEKTVERRAIIGQVPSPIHLPSGCRFHPRCPKCEERCRVEAPSLVEMTPNHAVACFYPDNVEQTRRSRSSLAR